MTAAGERASIRSTTRFAEDYRALRTGVGAVAAARATCCAVSGPDAVEYLQGQLSQDVAALGRGGVGRLADPHAPGQARRPGARVARR